MTDEHGNFAQLVVGHVLGDLSDRDASRFRSHLLGCRDCRARVAEFRGIAADLAEAERDELARARVRTETPRRVDRSSEFVGDATQRITIRHVTVATFVVILLAAAMGFWNLHLRGTTATLLAVAEQQRDTLEGLATGVPLEVELAEGVSGQAVADGDQVAISLAGVAPLERGERLMAWFLGAEDGPSAVQLAAPGELDGGTLAATLADAGARELVITRERAPRDAPAGAQVLQADLLPGGTNEATEP